MPRLSDVQADFAAALRDPRATAMMTHLAPLDGDALAETARFNVYRNNVASSLTDALAALYPVCRRLVGEDFFRAAARAYLAGAMPERATLIGFAQDFAGFLVGFEPARGLAYLPDVARLEHAWHRVYHGADSVPVTAADLAGRDGDDLARTVLALPPAHALLMSPHPVSRIWEANQPGRDGHVRLDAQAGGERLYVVRPRAQVEVRRLAPGAFAFLCAVAAGETLGRAMLAAFEADETRDPAATFAELLAAESFILPAGQPQWEEHGS